MKAPTIVLGAGIAGVSAALHLQARGVSVVLVDRGMPGGETSFGNAGLIEQSTPFPHPCPQDLRTLGRYVLNIAPDLRWRPGGLLAMADGLYGYWRNSRPDRIGAIGASFRSLMGQSLAEHRVIAEAAGAADLLRPGGWLELVRDPRALAVDRQAEVAPFGIRVDRLDGAALQSLEPGLRQPFAGAFHWRATVSITDPGAYVARLARAFQARGGTLETAQVQRLHRHGAGWQVQTSCGPIEAARVVIALGPWSPDLLRTLGLRVPMLFKRGYHRPFAMLPGARLNHPVHVPGSGHLVVPMAMGLRVLTGVELAPRDAPPDPRQIRAAEAAARAYLPMGEALGAPWMGARPCLPDMLPLIGEASGHRGLWFLFGHGHHGLTQGPASARLLAELMTSEAPLVPPAPFSPARLGL